jgi:hypothetical protein
LLGNTSIADVVVGFDRQARRVSVLALHFAGSLNTSLVPPIHASIEICGLPPGSGTTLTTWLVDEEHCTYWSAWEKDVAFHIADSNHTLSWPADVSRFDETAPAAVKGRKGWEWVAQEWHKYAKLAELAPTATGVPVVVAADGCTVLEAALAAHAVALYEMQLPIPPPPPPTPAAQLCTGCKQSTYHAATCQCGCSGYKPASCCCQPPVPSPCLRCKPTLQEQGAANATASPQEVEISL